MDTEEQAVTQVNMSGKSRNWCFTLNANEADGEHIQWMTPGISCPIESWLTSCKKIQYLVCQVEKVAHVHIQGYVQFTGDMRLAALKKLSSSAHWEIRRGSHKEARDYAKKEDTRANGPWEFGEEKDSQGKRTDWSDVSERLRQGSTKKEILLDHPHLAPCAKGIDALAEAHRPAPPLQRDITVYFLWGPTGTGKTHRAFTSFPQAYKVKGKYFEGKSFDNYDQEKVLILDEWSPMEWDLTFMNSILDKWECRLQCRYFNKYAYWEKVIICTNFKPEECYQACFALQRDTFRRRLTHVYEIISWELPVVDFGLALPIPSLPIAAPKSPVASTSGTAGDSELDAALAVLNMTQVVPDTPPQLRLHQASFKVPSITSHSTHSPTTPMHNESSATTEPNSSPTPPWVYLLTDDESS